MQISGIGGLEAFKVSVETETENKKCHIMIGSCCNWMIASVLGVLMMVWMANVHNIQNSWKKNDICFNFYAHDFNPGTDPVNGCDSTFYDIGFAYSEFGSDVLFNNEAEAQDLIEQIEADGCDNTCIKQGCRWSIIYQFCGWTMLLVSINSILAFVGTWQHHVRALSGCCGTLLCCVNFAAIITTGVFRFNSVG